MRDEQRRKQMHIQNVFRSGGIMAGLICLLMVQIVYAGAESTGAEAEGLVWPEVSTQAFQSGQSAFEVLPVAQADPDSDFGEDVNVNMATIDDYLGLTDAVYRDMRMTEDPYDYEAIGGDSYLSGMIEGFELIPFPYLAPTLNMPPELGEGYNGPTLFTVDEDGHYVPCYEESVSILEEIFPKDQAVLLMCGAGGYAGMTRGLLLDLGWDERMVFNTGGYWFYEGEHGVPTPYEAGDDGEKNYDFSQVPEIRILFDVLTPAAGTEK